MEHAPLHEKFSLIRRDPPFPTQREVGPIGEVVPPDLVLDDRRIPRGMLLGHASRRIARIDALPKEAQRRPTPLLRT